MITDPEQLTIASLFALSPDNPAELAAGLHDDHLGAISNAAKSLSEPVPWSSIRTEVAGAMAGALQTKVLGGWMSAWQKYRELKEKAEESRESPDIPFPCTLHEHTIESTLHPYVRVFLGQSLIQEINFDVTLETHISGLILSLQAGEIVSLQVGRCEWSGSIAMEGVQLIHRDLAQLDLPRAFVLKHPISVVPQDALATEPS
jgi:hypothetical protein